MQRILGGNTPIDSQVVIIIKKGEEVMCCAFLTLVFLGPRFFGAMWWLFQPARWQIAFTEILGGNLW